MDGTLGVVIILVVGITLLVVAALADWRSRRRLDAALQQAPDRGPAMADAPVPRYLPEPSPDERPRLHPLTSQEQADLNAELATDQLRTVAATLADARLATTTDPQRAIIRGPLVMVCPEGVGSLREVLDTLNRASQQKSGIVLVAPSFDAEVLDVMSINVDRGILEALPLRADEDTCAQIAGLTGATGVPRADLQAGYLPHSVYGRALLVVAGLDQTVLVAPPA
ncbi:hypothetical protein IPV09_05435 [Tessaracoccus sp. SD287]|uniref:hypothetical protein n=1 Tax=Tessaracoccus sp. SD287 TaxID=2782008 RepID=UPI001A962ECD|nr:hypothetical protein [Tessaracoccus sp. SD287]MBO1030778.1 hypothetical protein [Tessaracoccus sp. SD287]